MAGLENKRSSELMFKMSDGYSPLMSQAHLKQATEIGFFALRGSSLQLCEVFACFFFLNGEDHQRAILLEAIARKTLPWKRGEDGTANGRRIARSCCQPHASMPPSSCDKHKSDRCSMSQGKCCPRLLALGLQEAFSTEQSKRLWMKQKYLVLPCH